MNPPTITPMAHQAGTPQTWCDHPRFYFGWGTGTGKTCACLFALWLSKVGQQGTNVARNVHDSCTPISVEFDNDLYPTPPYHRTVVVSTKTIVQTAWVDDAEHFPGLGVECVWATTAEKTRKNIRASNADVLTINFERFSSDVDLRRDLWRCGVRRVIVDEASKLKNEKSRITKTMTEFCNHMESVYMLSGTPVPNGDLEWFPQLNALNPKIFNGDKFYAWRAKWFKPTALKPVYTKGCGGQAKQVAEDWILKPEKAGLFKAVLRPHVHMLTKADVLDLPEWTERVVKVPLSSKGMKAYESMRKELEVEYDRDGTSGVYLAELEGKTNKLAQLASGWCYNDLRQAIDTGDSSKADALCDILDTIGTNEPVIIWCNFVEDQHRLAKLMEKRKESHAILAGGTKDPASIVKRFQAGEIQRLICHPASVGHGVTLHRACFEIWYTLPWSSELYLQGRDRINRKGQERKMTSYVMLAKGTIDERIRDVVTGKVKRQDAMIQAIKGA